MSTAQLKNQIKKWLWYVLLLLVCYVLQTTPGLFVLFGVKPVLIVPLAIAIGVYEGEISAAAIGAVAGLLWDLSAGRIAGLYGLILCVICTVCCMTCLHFLRPTIVNITVLSGLSMVLASGLDFFFTYFLFYQNTIHILVYQILPTCLYTTLVAPLLIVLVRLIHKRYYLEEL